MKNNLHKNVTYILLVLLLPVPGISQYRGGKGRSESAVVANTNQLDGGQPKPYSGGSGRGESSFFETSIQLDGNSIAIYGGGIGRGEFISPLNSNQLDGSVLSIYGGGIGRGENVLAMNTNQLDGNMVNIYGGGAGRGETIFAMNTNQLDGRMVNIYGGGAGRGETIFGAYTSQLDGLVENSMFLGGSGRGESFQQTLGSSALPIILLSFSAALDVDKVNLQWQTSSETNSAYFEVQKSTDGSTFTAIGKVAAAGHSSTPLAYQLVDHFPKEGLNYYRLKSTDLDGKFVFSAIDIVRYHTGTTSGVTVYPNPVTYEFTVALPSSPAASKMNLSLVNAHGQVVFKKQNLTGSSHTFNIAHVSAGIYYLVVEHDGIVTTTKIIKE